MKVRCPICKKFFKFRYKLKDVEGATFNCKQCGELLIIKNQTIKDFHLHLHSTDPSWPKDGRGTMSIGLSNAPT